MNGQSIVKPLLVVCCLFPSEAFPSPSFALGLCRAPSSRRPGSSRGGRPFGSCCGLLFHIPSFYIHHSNSFRNTKKYSSSHSIRKKRFLSTTSFSSSSSSSNEGEESSSTQLIQLRSQNKILQERLRLLQAQNDQLIRQQQTFTSSISNRPATSRKQNIPYEQRLILEDFEGEGIPTFDARGGMIDGWDKSKRRYSEPWDDAEDFGEYNMEFEIGRLSAESEETDDEFGLSAPLEDDVCEYDDQSNKWMSNVGECPVEPNITFVDAMKSRARWLVGLLVLQSCSGFILSRNEILLQDHPVIIYFLTMLVGAGGNAGNQASVRVIRGLALGTLNSETQSQFLSRELRMAFALSLILSLAGFLRATLFHTPLPETIAITFALSMIVFSSICLGAVLPLLLQKLGVDPAHSSTTIQVVMDVLGGEYHPMMSSLNHAYN